MTFPRSSLSVLILIIAVALQQYSCTNLTTLRLVQVIYRHGDRAPIFTYPTDPHKDFEKYWPSGLGQLTSRGKDQLYDLGQYLRNRYDGFIDRLYNRKEIQVLSSDTDRTLLSAQANLAGLFPRPTAFSGESLKSLDEFNRKVDMQLIPIHTMMKENDKLLYLTANCPRKQVLMSEYKNSSPVIKQLRIDNEGLMRYVLENTGLSLAPGQDVVEFMKVSDIFHSQQEHNLAMPTWLNSTILERMRHLNGIRFSLKGGTDEMRRLFGGPLVQRLMENMLTETTQGEPKMYMFSGHDETLAAVMTAMGVFDAQNPDYASVFMVELHQEESTGKYFVELFYRNSTEREPYALRIPGCASLCYLDDMNTLLTPIIPTDWEAECQLQSLPSIAPQPTVLYSVSYKSSFLYFIAVIATSIITCAAFLCLVSQWKSGRIIDGSHPAPGSERGSYTKIP